MRPGPGTKERIFQRYIDSRFAAVKSTDVEHTVSLTEKFYEIEMDFLPTPGNKIFSQDGDDGVTMINDALSFDTGRPISFPENMAHLFVSEDCENVIWAMENWTGEGGQKGACKDFVDVVRWAAVLECEGL